MGDDPDLSELVGDTGTQSDGDDTSDLRQFWDPDYAAQFGDTPWEYGQTEPAND